LVVYFLIFNELLASFHVNVGDDDAVSPAEEKEKKKE